MDGGPRQGTKYYNLAKDAMETAGATETAEYVPAHSFRYSVWIGFVSNADLNRFFAHRLGLVVLAVVVVVVVMVVVVVVGVAVSVAEAVAVAVGVGV